LPHLLLILVLYPQMQIP